MCADCDGVQSNSDVQDCACKNDPVQCPTAPIVTTPVPPTPGPPRQLPAWWFGYYDHVLRRDRATGRWMFEALCTPDRVAAVQRRLTELSRRLGRRVTLDDIPDAELDRLAQMGFDWLWLLSVWQTGSGTQTPLGMPSAPGKVPK